MTLRAPPLLVAALPSLALAAGCADVTRFSNTSDHYAGTVVAGDFVRAGFDVKTGLCLHLDASHLQDGPGTLSSSDGRFRDTPLRPISQLWYDPLSTLSFGEGRVQNLVYIVTPLVDADARGDVTAVVSLMQSGAVEVRLFRGAGADNLFGVFSLTRTAGDCSF